MRKWRCVKSNSIYFTIGGIYETDENGNGLTDDSSSNKSWTNPWRFRLGGFNGAEFEEVFKEEEKKVNKFKVGDIVIRNNSHRYGYTNKGVKYEVTKVFNKEEINVKIIFGGDVEYIVESKYFDLFKSYNTKTLTITTSDSTTTLSDGTHTTSINRYYTDKHDVKVAVNEVVKKYFDEVEMEEKKKNRPTKGKDLIGVEITKGTRFKVINIEPHKDRPYVCLNEYIGKIGVFAKDSFKFTENGYMYSATFEEEYMNAIDKKNGELCWRYDEVEILWED